VKTTLALAVLLVALVGVQASGASAHTLAKGKSYGCQIHPNAKVCKKAPKPVKGVVTGVSQAPVVTLPQTGGANPQPGNGWLPLLALAAVALLGGGRILRTASRRR
jgi:hypothetical protein